VKGFLSKLFQKKRGFHLSDLKKLRVFVSVFIFLLTALLFLSFDPDSKFASSLSGSILFLQFVPSAVKFFYLFTIASIGFFVIIILTFFFGRVYCSTICPLGTLQDIISFLSKKIKRKKYFGFSKPHSILRYSILSITLLSVLSGFIIFLNLLDPYSNFGKISSLLFKPVLIFINNIAASSLENLNLYIIYPVEFKGIRLFSLIYPLIFLLVVVWLSFNYGRLFCNTICPVGTLLGFISKFSLFKISAESESCRGCRLCERACKAGCIDKNNKEVDFTRCVGCYNCFTVCPKNKINFVRRKYKTGIPSSKLPIDEGKRNFIKSSVTSLFSLAGISIIQIIPKKESKVPVYRANPVSPPGSKSLEHFTDTCTACHLCVSACPAQVLQPSFLEYGFLGILQPVMDYSTSYCNYECTICTEVCPTGAILPLRPEEKKLIQLGKSKFIKENCVVFTENTACGACSEHCPTKAVKMIPYVPENNPSLKNLHLPEVHEEYCTGCGACEHACPTKPYKSIYVEGNPVHLAAKKPPKEKLEEKIDYQEDFPF
jgi:ferredoxin